MIGVIKNKVDSTITQILEKFYAKDNVFSDVTSSHWIKYDNNVLEVSDGYLELKNAGGFGDFVSSTLVNRIRLFPEIILTAYIVRKYKVDSRLVFISRKICKKQKKLQLFDSVKHLILLDNLIKNYDLGKYESYCVIGDGFGYLTTVLRELYPNKKIFNVNLGRQLLYDYVLFHQACPDEKVFLFEDGNENAVPSANTILIPAEKYHVIKDLNIEFFFNVASMQEMDLNIIKNYFDFIKQGPAREKVIYCCNRDSKYLPDGSLISFDDYGWSDGEILFDNKPAWYQFYPMPKPPFWKPFSGVIRERLYRF